MINYLFHKITSLDSYKDINIERNIKNIAVTIFISLYIILILSQATYPYNQ
ncbi:hypothetical protein JCM10003_3027 [Bacteroides pyogenes JCM 10003]|nr:hypothetical protein JCM10003_3027 [Bacteroides pyogenes JCM 10003]